MTLLVPKALLLALLAIVPVVAVILAERRVRRARTVLGLAAAPSGTVRRAVALAASVALVAVAAAQPCLTTSATQSVRTDAAVLVVVDTSRSMVAGSPTRLERAKREALAVRAALPNVRVGLATFTDRILPDVFPIADASIFDSVVQAVRVEDPPPRESSQTATTFDALSELAGSGFFRPADRVRAAVVITDGESRPFDAAAVRDALQSAHIRLSVVRVGTPRDRIAGEPYRPAPVDVHGLGGEVAPAKLVGSGAEQRVTTGQALHPLGPWVALLALLPFLLASPRAGQRLPWAPARPAQT